jgi:glycerol-3-phosphate acyltransferase PlsY
MNYAWIFSTFTLAYFLGSIPFGLILTRLSGAGDIRKIGSGNIGATNVMRTGRKGLAIATLLLDGLKGYAAVELARTLYMNDFAILAGLFAVIGHVFPVWLRFKGGKGVATTIGVFFAMHWLLGVSVCVIWLAGFLILRISSLSAMLAIGYSSIAAYLITDDATAILCLALAVLIFFTHRTNIKRLLDGSEHKFREKKS